MKTIQFITLLFLFTPLLTNAQINDLAKIMNNKKLISYNNIYNIDNTLFGSILIYSGEKVERRKREYEYLILDKNLNKIAKNVFIQKKGSMNMLKYNFYVSSIIGDTFLLKLTYYMSDYTGNRGPDILYTYREINIKNNTISDEFYPMDNEFHNLDLGKGNILKFTMKLKTVPRFFSYSTSKDVGYMLIEHSKRRSKNYLIKEIKTYDLNKKPKWTFSYNKNASKDNYKKISDIYWEDNLAIFKFDDYYKKRKMTGITIMGADLTTGEKKFEYNVENTDSEFSHKIFDIKKYGNKIHIAGLFFPKKDRNEFDKKMGVFKITIDDTGKELFNKHTPWEAASKYIEINKYAKLKKGYRLSNRDFFIFKDGSISYLAEKYKPRKEIIIHISSKSTDLVMMNFNNNLDVKDVITINKAKSKTFHYDYLFSQYIKDNTGCVFFFQDYMRDREKKDHIGVLGINKYLNSEYSFEEMPIYSKKENYQINPFPAKEGYIMLREYNEDEKHDQIRLEKINY